MGKTRFVYPFESYFIVTERTLPVDSSRRHLLAFEIFFWSYVSLALHELLLQRFRRRAHLCSLIALIKGPGNVFRNGCVIVYFFALGWSGGFIKEQIMTVSNFSATWLPKGLWILCRWTWILLCFCRSSRTQLSNVRLACKSFSGFRSSHFRIFFRNQRAGRYDFSQQAM